MVPVDVEAVVDAPMSLRPGFVPSPLALTKRQQCWSEPGAHALIAALLASRADDSADAAWADALTVWKWP
jgi:hypothetical protein